MTAATHHLLYARVLGAGWPTLPPQLRAMHTVTPVVTAEGTVDVERGTGRVARLLAAIARLPQAGRQVPLRVRMSTIGSGERWQRSFDGRSFDSHQTSRWTSQAVLLDERVGPVVLTFRVTNDDTTLTLTPQAWRILGIPLPRFHMPITEAREYVDEHGRFAFVVEASHRWTGLIVRYSGWLEPAAPQDMDKISRKRATFAASV